MPRKRLGFDKAKELFQIRHGKDPTPADKKLISEGLKKLGNQETIAEKNLRRGIEGLD